VAAISIVDVPTHNPGRFSQLHPGCFSAPMMLTGAATLTRSSAAIRRSVCVAPPEAPVTPIRDPSTSGSDERKSSARMLFQSCTPPRLKPYNSASGNSKSARNSRGSYGSGASATSCARLLEPSCGNWNESL
jgi:hypothetical protein